VRALLLLFIGQLSAKRLMVHHGCSKRCKLLLLPAAMQVPAFSAEVGQRNNATEAVVGVAL
jgi:hypothetical protein